MAITLIATGGTIASTRGPDGSVTATRSGADLLAGLPQHGVDVEVVERRVPGSWNLSSTTAAAIATEARRALDGGHRGVVITHGTDVLEETAWLTELLVAAHARTGAIVLTASMRHGSEFAGDGPRNLLDALAVADDPAAAGRGALVCVNGELHHARWVIKSHATALSTFESPGRGPVGEVGEAGVRFLGASPAAPPAMDRPLRGQVPILASHWDVPPGLVEWYLDGRADGIVVEATGAGNVNGGLAEGLQAAFAAGVPVVVTTRCRRGEVTPVYGGVGGFATLVASGAIPSHGLTAGKARLALQVALGNATTAAEVPSLFERLAAVP